MARTLSSAVLDLSKRAFRIGMIGRFSEGSILAAGSRYYRDSDVTVMLERCSFQSAVKWNFSLFLKLKHPSDIPFS